jgi:hypothetical protein
MRFFNHLILLASLCVIAVSCKENKEKVNPDPLVDTTNTNSNPPANTTIGEVQHRYSGRWIGTRDSPKNSCNVYNAASPAVYMDFIVYSDSSFQLKGYQNYGTTTLPGGHYHGILDGNKIQAKMLVQRSSCSEYPTRRDTTYISTTITESVDKLLLNFSVERRSGDCDNPCLYYEHYSYSK